MDTNIHRWQTFLSITVQHIQSPHARDEIKLIKYATCFRDVHAPTPNYTSQIEGEVEVAIAVVDMAVAVAARLAVAMIILAVVATVATVATTAAKAEVEEATARSHGAWAPLH
jgi:hypothetical protein